MWNFDIWTHKLLISRCKILVFHLEKKTLQQHDATIFSEQFSQENYTTTHHSKLPSCLAWDWSIVITSICLCVPFQTLHHLFKKKYTCMLTNSSWLLWLPDLRRRARLLRNSMFHMSWMFHFISPHSAQFIWNYTLFFSY